MNQHTNLFPIKEDKLLSYSFGAVVGVICYMPAGKDLHNFWIIILCHSYRGCKLHVRTFSLSMCSIIDRLGKVRTAAARSPRNASGSVEDDVVVDGTAASAEACHELVLVVAPCGGSSLASAVVPCARQTCRSARHHRRATARDHNTAHGELAPAR